MSGLAFYTNPMPRGRIARWMPEEVGAPYETVVLGYGTSMKDAGYLAVAFPDAGLAPTAAERADHRRWLFYAAGRSGRRSPTGRYRKDMSAAKPDDASVRMREIGDRG